MANGPFGPSGPSPYSTNKDTPNETSTLNTNTNTNTNSGTNVDPYGTPNAMEDDGTT